jgi:hypothetical protein
MLKDKTGQKHPLAKTRRLNNDAPYIFGLHIVVVMQQWATTTLEPQRIQRSVATSIMAYLMIVKFHAQDVPQRGPWSVFTLKRNCTWQIAQSQIARSVEQCLRPGLPARKAV